MEVLGLPARAREEHRLTKKDIVEQWEHSAPADARLLGRAIGSARIVGVLSPATTGVPAVRDANRPVDMIPVLEVRVANGVTAKDQRRVAELLHRAMPRPSAIATYPSQGAAVLSLALTRLSKSEAGMSVVEKHLTVPIDGIAVASLHVGELDRADLGSLYRDLVRRAAADGVPAPSLRDAAEAVELRRRLAAVHEDLQSAMRSAAREKSMQRRIEYNGEARSLRDQIAQTRAALFGTAADQTRTSDDPKVGP
ncbi:DUF4391 domain-containing protein [Demequina capsici]|uniref:DUF4391 domain-containing protein n=1 Tax=Demequina capsici TaxID=3075620 RepID=A0AA96F662_9MICO|nr:DUF4391 domain-containing protein [Demequina sp. OYTSA14]WNM23522.1 DUF4391 domain-containing protein [Demequina sp. OYTSA14]